jgi:HSP20 family protein
MFGLTPSKRNPEAGTGRTHEGGLMERPWSGLAQLRQDLDGLFERFWADFPRFSTPWDELDRMSGVTWEDEENRYVLRAEAPGFEPQEFDVQIRGTQLVLTAEHKEEQKEEHGHRRFAGRLYQSVALPPGVLADQVEAKYRNGILEISLPKNPEARPQRITVKPA